MHLRLLAASTLAAAFALASAAATPAAPASDESAAERRLDDLIESRLRAGGPFFTPAERAAIERKCGYAPGSWDGYEASIIGDAFHCTNGRRLTDRETRAILAAARPRIEARVEHVMATPQVRAAIDEVAQAAEAQALRDLARETRRR